MKYSHVEIQAPLLVELLLNDPAIGRGVTVKEIDEVYTDEGMDNARDILYQIYQKADDRKLCCTLKERLNTLLEQGEITVLSIDNAANEIMISWCGMVGCVLYRQDYNTWEMHT